MTPTIYIGSSKLIFTAERPSEACLVLKVDTSLHISRAKVIKNLETNKFVAVMTPDPELAFAHFAEQFVAVEAAGGVVRNERGELLMILLRGRWDLPKGHVEAGEDCREAALREVREETGVVAQTIGDEHLCRTWHAYDTYGRWELKCTTWWAMTALSEALVAQTEEGISEVRWCSADEVAKNMNTTYETIKMVVTALESRDNLKDYEQ